MSSYFEYEALDIPTEDASDELQKIGIDIKTPTSQYNLDNITIPDYQVQGLNLNNYFSTNMAEEPVKYDIPTYNPNNYKGNRKALEEAFNKQGIYGQKRDTLTRLAYLESRFTSNATSNKSSAAGLFQFIDSTRKTYSNVSKQQFLNSIDEQVRAASKLYDANKTFLVNNGVTPTEEAIAATWLNPTWTKNYFKKGQAGGSDANGTNVAKYINMFKSAKI